MFRQVISSTPMVSKAADSIFTNIYGQGYRDDYTFLSTLRALLAPRMEKGDIISLHFEDSNYITETITSNEATKMVKAIYNTDYYLDGSIVIHSFNGSSEGNAAAMTLMKDNFCEVYGWQRLDKITDFFRKTFSCLCFINPESRKVVIFIDSLNIRIMHYLQCAIFAFLPWYFNPEDGVTEDEMELIQSLREKTPDKYESCIAKMAAQYDFRAMHIRETLAGFEVRFEKKERETTLENIKYIIRKIELLEDSIADYFRKKREQEIKLLGLETKIKAYNDEESEIVDYFLCNNKLVIDSVDDRSMTFAVRDYLMYFDEDLAKTIIDNDRSYVYCLDGYSCNEYIKADDMKKLMYAIFIDQIFKLRFCSAYSFELGVCVRGIDYYDYGFEFKEYMPNPHIDQYSCIGNYEMAINNCIKNNDYIGAIEQSIASCKSLNFGDSTVMKEFMKRLYGINGYTQNRCIETPDGKVLTAKEAISWINANEKKKIAENEQEVEADE